jgi:hypothetical protein
MTMSGTGTEKENGRETVTVIGIARGRETATAKTDTEMTVGETRTVTDATTEEMTEEGPALVTLPRLRLDLLPKNTPHLHHPQRMIK